MKKLVLIGALAVLMAGCGTAAMQSELWKHPTMYKNMDHLKYSWAGYAETSPGDVQASAEQKWWGIPQGGAK